MRRGASHFLHQHRHPNRSGLHHLHQRIGYIHICIENRAAARARGIDGDMVFKLSGRAHAQALRIPGAHLFDPMGGRPMKEWVVVPAPQAAEWANLADAAMEYCSAR